MNANVRPTPVGTATRGQPGYAGPELAAYRALHGFNQEAVAQNMGVTRRTIVNIEQRALVPEGNALRYVKAVDYLAARRRAIADAGAESLRLIRAERGDAAPLAERVLAAIAERSPAAVTADVAEAVGEPVDVVADVIAGLIHEGRATIAVRVPR